MATGEFYWAVVGDANPEPVAVVVEGGKRVAYTCGCPDPFDVDGPDARIVLIGTSGRHEPAAPLRAPPTPNEVRAQDAVREAQIKADKRRGITHGHRRFNP